MFGGPHLHGVWLCSVTSPLRYTLMGHATLTGGGGGEHSKTSPFQSPVHSGDVGLVIPQTGGSPVENCNM